MKYDHGIFSHILYSVQHHKDSMNLAINLNECVMVEPCLKMNICT